MLVASCAGTPQGLPFPLVPTTGGRVDTAYETTHLALDLNRLRKSQGLEEWTYPAALQQIALARGLELASRGTLSHYRLVERTPPILTMLEVEGYAGRMAELLIRVRNPGEGLAPTVLRAWFEDEPHRADILSSDYHASGVGIASGEGEWIVVLVLAEYGPLEEVEP